MWLLLCERLLPYRKPWTRPDGQLKPDLAHTFLNKGLVQLFIVSLIGFGLLDNNQRTLISTWSLPAQVVFGLIASEFGLYWAHRIAHEWPWLWRFHAVHHSVKKLWIVNTGRFHFVDTFASVFASLPIFLISGMSMDAIVWVSACTAYLGILTHCNVDMRCGFLSYLFNTPNLHRWHHSIEQRIGNNNYGENLMLWDHLFGSFYYPAGKHVDEIGINEAMPKDFLGQLKHPFEAAT